MTYKVKSNLMHDGIAYEAGQTVEMSEEQAQPLLTDGILGNVGEADEPELEVVQPAVNEVKRENDDVNAKPEVTDGEPTVLGKPEDPATEDEGEQGDDSDQL